jgi:hypothetical protein
MASIVEPYDSNAVNGSVAWFPDAGSSAFAAGDLVYLASGQLTVYASDGTLILGIALTKQSAVANTVLPVLVIRPGEKYIMTPSTTAVQGTHVGNSYGLVGTTTANTVDLSDTTNDRVIVREILADGRVVVTFRELNLQFGGHVND